MARHQKPNLKQVAERAAKAFFADIRGLDLLPYCNSTTEAYDVAELLENARVEIHWKA